MPLGALFILLAGCAEDSPLEDSALILSGGESPESFADASSAWDLEGNFQVVLEKPQGGAVFTAGFPVEIQGAVVHPSEDLSTLRLDVVSRHHGTLATLNPQVDGSFAWTWEQAFSKTPLGDDAIQVVAFDSVGAIAQVESSILINTPPAIPVFELAPSEPRTGDSVQLTILEVFDKELAAQGNVPVHSTVWRKLNSETVVEGDILPSSATERGDVWVVEVVASDPYGASVPASETVSIYNTPPSVGDVGLERDGTGVESSHTHSTSDSGCGWGRSDLQIQMVCWAWNRLVTTIG